MGIHYSYKNTKSSKLMEKQAKREKKLAEKKAKREAKEGPRVEEELEEILPSLTCLSTKGEIISSSSANFLIDLSESIDIIYFSSCSFFEKFFFF